MSDGNDKPSCWSNVGGTSVDLFAPGESHLRDGRRATTVHGYLVSRSGTSMSAPLVAGAAALLKGKSNTLSADLIKEALLEGVDGFGPLGAISVSGGRLNAARPLLEAGADRLLRGGAASGQLGEWTIVRPRSRSGPLRRRQLPDPGRHVRARRVPGHATRTGATT